MFCKVLRIVFTLFFLFLLGSQYPVSLGPMVRLLNHVFCFYWAPSTPFLWAGWFGCSACFLFLLGSQYPVSPGPMVRLLSLLFVSIGIPVPRFSGPLESLCTFFRVTNSKNSTDSSGVHWSGVHWSWYVLKCSLEPLFYALLSIGVLWSPL